MNLIWKLEMLEILSIESRLEFDFNIFLHFNSLENFAKLVETNVSKFNKSNN